MKIREPAVEGTFYPGDKEELRSLIRRYIENSEFFELPDLKAIVAPHAGYIYSGVIAGASYRQLNNLDSTKFYRVFIIAPSHYEYFRGASVGVFDAYKTPLGLVKVSKIASRLLEEDGFHFLLDAHIEEHAVEVQLPFLQYALQDFEIIPILTGDIDPSYLANVLEKYSDEPSLFIVSSDLSHYYEYGKAIQLDKHCNNAITNLDFKELAKCQACGKTGIKALMHLAKKLGWQSKIITYANSGDTAGPKTKVVGYGSYAFYKE